jgi:hypothetical protein
MSFVQAKFPLPTVSKADGTLGAYVQYPANPRGQQFIWPAQRIAILMAKQKADKAKKKSGTLGVVTMPPAGPAADITQAVYDAGPNGTQQDAVLAYLTNRYKNDNSKADPNAAPKPNSNLALYLGGGLAAAAVLIAIVKRARR